MSKLFGLNRTPLTQVLIAVGLMMSTTASFAITAINRPANAVSSTATWAEEIQYLQDDGSYDLFPGDPTVTATTDGGALIFNKINPDSAAGSFVKLSATGEIEWSTAYKTDDYSVYAFDPIKIHEIKETTGISYLALGKMFDPRDIVAIKLSANGDIVWKRIFNATLPTGSQIITRSTALSSTNTIMLGGYVNNPSSSDAWMAEIDIQGNMLRTGTWSPSTPNNAYISVEDMVQDGSNWVLLLDDYDWGTSDDYGDNRNQVKIMTVRANDMSVVSEKTLNFSSIEGEGLTTPRNLVHLKDGSWAVTGYVASMAQYSQNIFHSSHSHFFATLSADLSQISALRILNTTSKGKNTTDYLGEAIPLANGNYAVMGVTYGNRQTGIPYLIELDKNQNMIWAKSYGATTKQTSQESLLSSTPEGGYLIGFSNNTNDDRTDTGSAFTVAKLDNRGATKKSIPCFKQSNGIDKLYVTLSGMWAPTLTSQSNSDAYSALPTLSLLSFPFEVIGDAQASVTQKCNLQ